MIKSPRRFAFHLSRSSKFNMTTLKLVLTLCMIAHSLTLISCQYNEKDCDVGPLQADRCARTMMFEGDRERFVPRDEKDMEKHCRILNDSIKCMERHTKCYKSLSRQLFSLGVRNMKRTHKTRCKTKNGRKEFLRHMGCIVDEKMSEPIHKCVDKWTWMINFILKNVSHPEKQFPSACCSFHVFESCLMKEATALCSSRTGAATAVYIRDVVKDGVAEFMDLACNKVRSVADCRQNEAALTKIFEDQMRIGVPKQTTSALFPFLQLATKLDQ